VSKRKTPQCKRCGVEMEPHEDRQGDGWCYVCAPERNPLQAIWRGEESEAPDWMGE
jgi:hypothetical protein